MIFSIYIESHTDFPDYENKAEASSEEEAVQIFYDDLRGGLDRDFIRQNILEE